MKWLLWVLLLLAPLIGHAGALEETVVNAFREIQHTSHHDIWEYGGIIVERNGQLMYPAIPHTDGKIDSLFFDMKVLLQPGDVLRATYHTHPCSRDYWSGLFSVNDIMQSVAYRTPNFILDQCSGLVHEFWYGIDNVWDTGMTVIDTRSKEHKLIHLPSGRIVGHL